MAHAIDPSLHIDTLGYKRSAFKTLRIGQVFWYRRHWWRKVSTQCAERADAGCTLRERFPVRRTVKVPLSLTPAVPVEAESYEEFLERIARS